MLIYLLRLGFSTALPVMVTLILYFVDKHSAFRDFNYWVKQSIIGVCFGIVACMATTFGIPYEGFVVNVRNAAPITAGLIFGAPAGIIAGVIGGIHRYLSTFWGVGTYTWIACSVSTVLAGLMAAGIHRIVFEGHRTNFIHGIFVTVSSEMIHMLLIFLTHLDSIEGAFEAVRVCSSPLIVSNSISVVLSIVLVSALSGNWQIRRTGRRPISQTIALYFSICLIIAEVVTVRFLYTQQTKIVIADTKVSLQQEIADMNTEINDVSLNFFAKKLNELMITFGSESRYWDYAKSKDEMIRSACRDQLIQMVDRFRGGELSLLDEEGVVLLSSEPEAEGKFIYEAYPDVYTNLRTYISEDASLFQLASPKPDVHDDPNYLAEKIEGQGYLMFRCTNSEYTGALQDSLYTVALKRHIGKNGFVVIADRDTFEPISKPEAGMSQDEITAFLEQFPPELYGQFRTGRWADGEEYAYIIDRCEYCLMVAAIPMDEILYARDVSIYMTVYSLHFILLMIYVMIFIVIKRLVLNSVHDINKGLEKITDGDLDVKVNVRNCREFTDLSDDINVTVDGLKKLIAEASARIDQELQYARKIQSSALPSVFPAYPDRPEIDIYAKMKPAKEVGGDFYDFSFLDDHTLMFMVADVSGKGIPAALFMMQARTLMKGYAENGFTLSEAMEKTNHNLCDGNDAEMFVTVWMGFLDLCTGKLSYANGGHNPPVLLRKGEEPEWLKERSGLVLGGIDGMKYKQYELQMNPGDTIFLYTDGVTEARSPQNEMYGEERVLKLLKRTAGCTSTVICNTMKEDMNAFIANAPQFDDITMLCVSYRKAMEEKEGDEFNA